MGQLYVVKFQVIQIFIFDFFSVCHSFTHSFIPHLLRAHYELVLVAMDIVVNKTDGFCLPELPV